MHITRTLTTAFELIILLALGQCQFTLGMSILCRSWYVKPNVNVLVVSRNWKQLVDVVVHDTWTTFLYRYRLCLCTLSCSGTVSSIHVYPIWALYADFYIHVLYFNMLISTLWLLFQYVVFYYGMYMYLCGVGTLCCLLLPGVLYIMCRYSMGLIPTRKSLALCEKVNTSHFCRWARIYTSLVPRPYLRSQTTTPTRLLVHYAYSTHISSTVS